MLKTGNKRRDEDDSAVADDVESADMLKEQAERCRRLSRATHDESAAEILRSMARNYDSRVDRLQGR